MLFKWQGALGAVALALCSAPSQADWVTGLTLIQLGSGDAGGEYVWFQTTTFPPSNPANCGNNDIYVLRTLPKNALAILLAAHVSGKPIRAYVSPTVCDAVTGRPLVTEVGIQ
jgi:hypothetical protein